MRCVLRAVNALKCVCSALNPTGEAYSSPSELLAGSRGGKEVGKERGKRRRKEGEGHCRAKIMARPCRE